MSLHEAKSIENVRRNSVELKKERRFNTMEALSRNENNKGPGEKEKLGEVIKVS